MTKITLLVDNLAQVGLKNEHGFALLIEHKDKRILFDTGQSDALFFNAKKLNISLCDLDIIVLSHGHYDHGGNLATLLLANPSARFYAHPDCTNTRYSLHPDKPIKKISLTAEAIESINNILAKRCNFITQATEITTGIWLSGEIPRISDFEDTGGPFFLDTAGENQDLLKDDMSLWIENENDITVICGCCHAGIVNTLDYIQKQQSQTKRIKTVMGGLHLVNASQHRIEQTIKYLNQQYIEQLYPAHCTGNDVMSQLNAEFKNTVQIAKAGLSLTIT